MGRIVGIDLGTTNSLVAYTDPQTGTPKCIPGPNGSTLCPSVVSLDPDDSIIVGEPARRRLLTQSERSIYSVKRLMGRGVADIQSELKLFPFRIDPTSKNVIRIKLGDKLFTPPEISAFILRELKNWAEAYFGETVDRAAKPRRTPAKLLALKFFAWSTSQRPLRWPTGCTKSSAVASRYTIWVAALSISRFLN
jgi:molecular chaperone DnaK